MGNAFVTVKACSLAAGGGLCNHRVDLRSVSVQKLTVHAQLGFFVSLIPTHFLGALQIRNSDLDLKLLELRTPFGGGLGRAVPIA